MSAGAMEPGLGPAVRGFSNASGQAVQIRYATAPLLQQALADGEAPQLVIGPDSLMAGLRGSTTLTPSTSNV